MSNVSSLNRQTKLNIILGTNGTGKSTLLNSLATRAAKAERRSLILTPDPTEWTQYPEITEAHKLYDFKGIKRYIYRGEQTILDVLANYHNGLLILDDYKAFGISSKKERETIRTLCIRRRQRMLDIFFVAHGFTEVVPLFLYTFATELILFRTIDNPKRVLHTFNNPEKMLNHIEQINRLALTANPHTHRIIKLK